MKKINYFLLLTALICTVNMYAKKTVVKNATDLISVFNAAQNGDTVMCAPGYYNVSNKLFFPNTGIITLTSQYPSIKDSIATVGMNMGGKAIPTGVIAGLIFESINLQHNNPTATSGHIIYINKVFGNIAKLVFRNCEISNGVRGLFRSVKPDNTTDVTYTSCGDLDYLEMTNCLIHNTFTSAGNNWPLLYLGHLPLEVNISNNTFYDLAYMKNIFTMNYADPNSGRNAKINFKNNTVSTTISGNYIATSNYLGEETEFNIENNVFVLPSWTNPLNIPTTDTKYYAPAIISCKGGIITAKNNVVDGPKPWIKGQTLDVDGQGGFIVIDTISTYKMTDLEIAWTDFADPEKGDYSILASKKLATYGVSGTPIGDTRWIKTYTNPKTLTVTANNTSAVTSPRRAYYENGSSVTVKASVVDGYNFKGWKRASDGTTVSTSNPYTFNITSDVDLIAEYILLQERKVAVTINGSKSATYTITPSKSIYYEGDVITIAVNKHYINDFLGWNDGNSDLSRTFSISGSDIALTANFTEHPYILAWDFDQITSNNTAFRNLAANHAADAANPGVMNYVTLDTIKTVSTRNNKFTGIGQELAYCATRRTLNTNFGNPDYLFIKFSTKGLSNMKIKSEMATDNSTFKVQKYQYALDGKNYIDFKVDTIKTNIDMVWRKFEGVLPVAAENQDSVWVRWIADNTSERLYVTGVSSSDYDYAYISKIVLIDSRFTDTKNLSLGDIYKVYSNSNKLFIRAEEKGKAEVFTSMGIKVKETPLNLGLNEFNGFKSGIYIIRIGSVVQKVLIK